MGHFAKVKDNIVLETIVAEPEYIDSLGNTYPIAYIQTSYNSRGNVHYLPDSNVPSGKPALRANYAGGGDIYDPVNDVFYRPRPIDMEGLMCESWTLNTSTWSWEPPIPMPTDAHYRWYERLQAWI